jgi:transcriptional regulator with XRE-family HTH domain
MIYNKNSLGHMRVRLDLVLANIRRSREALNLSQKEVADRLNMSQNAYSKLELGYTKLTLQHFLLIADALNVPYKNILE